MYRDWHALVPAGVEVVAVQPPGRANRLGEEPLDSFPALISGLLPHFAELADRPYALFGHSMGAVFAAELAAELVDAGVRAPLHLFLSSRQPPDRPSPVGPLSHLDDPAFVAEIDRRYGAIPREIMQAPEVLELLLPALRADIRALEALEGTGPRRLSAPISAFGGVADPLVPPDLLSDWESWTSGPFRLRLFAGGHFYLDTARTALISEIAATLGPAIGAWSRMAKA
jgi:medium-chain acyl-[acyl-carrier-protein] hydrolase